MLSVLSLLAGDVFVFSWDGVPPSPLPLMTASPGGQPIAWRSRSPGSPGPLRDFCPIAYLGIAPPRGVTEISKVPFCTFQRPQRSGMEGGFFLVISHCTIDASSLLDMTQPIKMLIFRNCSVSTVLFPKAPR